MLVPSLVTWDPLPDSLRDQEADPASDASVLSEVTLLCDEVLLSERHLIKCDGQRRLTSAVPMSSELAAEAIRLEIAAADAFRFRLFESHVLPR